MANVKNYALCLIDLQGNFRGSISAKCLRNVEREIELAKEAKRDILVVLFKECGSLIGEVARMLKGYEYQRTIYKKNCDGGFEVINELLDIKPQHVRVCGVQTDVCVRETVRSMAKLFRYTPKLRNKRIQVVGDACWVSYNNDQDGWAHSDALKELQDVPGVEVV